MLILNILYGLTLIVWLFSHVVLAFAFDAPGSGQEIRKQLFAGGILTYPLGVLGSYACWWFYQKQNYVAAYLITKLPLVWLIFIGGVLYLEFAANAK
jgi:hypothetical protein